MAKFEDFELKELLPLIAEEMWFNGKCECGKWKALAYRNKDNEPKRNRYCFECSQAKRGAEGGDNTYKPSPKASLDDLDF